MLLHHRTAQSSLEYMMTYGWAILIIVLVAAILYTMGIFSPVNTSVQAATGFAPFTFLSQYCSPVGMVVKLGNSIGTTVTIFNASILSAQYTSTSSTTQLNTTVAPGQNFNLVFYNTSCTTGNFYSSVISVLYGESTSSGLLKYKATGTISGKATSVNEITFMEYGLPAGAVWFVSYDGQGKSSGGGVLSFLNLGGEQFLIENTTINGVVYYPTAASGVLINNTLIVDFIPIRDMFVANGGSSTVSAINTNTNTIVRNITVTSNPFGIAVTPSGHYVYVTSHGNAFISVIDTNLNKVISNLSIGTNQFGVTINYNGTIAYDTAYGGGGYLYSINTSDLSTISSSKIGGAPDGIAISPISGLVFVAQNTNDSVAVVSPLTLSKIHSIRVGSAPTSIAVASDGAYALVTNDGSNTVSVINLSNYNVIKNISVGTYPYSVAISPDNTEAYVVNMNSNNVYVINTSTYTVIAQIPVGASPQSVAINPNGEYAYVTDYNSNSISIISTSSNSIVGTITNVRNPNGITDAPSGGI